MKLTKRLVALILGLTMLLCLAACGEQTETSTPAGSSAESNANVSSEASEASAEASSEASVPETPKFSVIVVDQDGNAVPGAMVQICKNTCMPEMSGEDGIAIFNVEITDGYKLSVMSLPEGYTYEGEAEIYLEYGVTEYTLTLTKGN